MWPGDLPTPAAPGQLPSALTLGARGLTSPFQPRGGHLGLEPRPHHLATHGLGPQRAPSPCLYFPVGNAKAIKLPVGVLKIPASSVAQAHARCGPGVPCWASYLRSEPGAQRDLRGRHLGGRLPPGAQPPEAALGCLFLSGPRACTSTRHPAGGQHRGQQRQPAQPRSQPPHPHPPTHPQPSHTPATTGSFTGGTWPLPGSSWSQTPCDLHGLGVRLTSVCWPSSGGHLLPSSNLFSSSGQDFSRRNSQFPLGLLSAGAALG